MKKVLQTAILALNYDSLIFLCHYYFMHILLIALRVSAGVHNNQYIIAQFLNLWSTDLLGVREVCDGIATFAG